MYMHIFIAMFKQRLNILNSIMSGLRLQITFVFRHGGGESKFRIGRIKKYTDQQKRKPKTLMVSIQPASG